MVIIQLEKEFEIRASDGLRERVFYLPSGMELTAISYSYLPDHYKEEWPDQADTEKRYFIVYIHERFIRIPKEHCNVPICYGWWYNL